MSERQQPKNWFTDYLETAKDNVGFITEEKIIEITEWIVSRMEELGVNRKTLAEKLNVSKAYVTKLLRGNINFTLKTIISVANVLESDIQFDFIPKGQKRRVLHYHDNSGSEATAKSKTTARNISAQKGKIYSVKYNNSDEEAISALTQGGADDYANAA